MSSVKQKLAALRAKRSAQKLAASTSANPALSAAALALGQPQVSWDADYKTKLEDHETSRDIKDSAVSSCSSDDDVDELVVLPPPKRKLNSAAQRQLWRMREIERARAKAAKTLMDLRPESFDVDEIPIEQCSEDPIAADGPDDGGEGGGEVTDNDEDEDEEEAARQQRDSDEMAAGDDLEKDEEEAALETAQRIEEEEFEDEQDELPLGPPPSVPKEHHEQTATPANNEPLQNEPLDAEDDARGVSPNKPQSTDTGPETEAKEDTSDPKASDEVPKTVLIRTSTKDDQTATSEPKPRKCNWFETWGKPAAARKSEKKRFSTGFVEEEAADDEDGENENDVSQLHEDSSDVEDQDDDMAEKENIVPSDNKKLAAFHQKWILEKEQDDLNSMKTAPGRMMVNDMDDAMDLTDLAHMQPDAMEENDNASEAGEGISEEHVFGNDQAKPENYVDAMFLRDDSRSRFLEEEDEEKEDDEEDNTNRREKARALWKARQKTKISLFQEDENSLSRFDIFGDADKSRSAHFRMKLESACRPVSLKDLDDRPKMSRDQWSTGVKRNTPWPSEASVPEWEKRNASIQQKQRKRQRSVSVGKWSYAAHGGKEKAPSKTSRAGSSGAGSASLGSTYQALKPRTHTVVPKRRSRASNKPGKTMQRSSSKGPTSFKGLLKVLGNRAETDL